VSPGRSTEHGKVWLVGAGPGAADLLTLRASRALAAADLVLYDALVDEAALGLAPRAAKFSVGKRAGRASVAQDTIHALLVRAARAGKRVVRLKCGDPFVLGRGGEEALALAEAGVAVEVVPGVSSAIAGPGAAGIPVPLRGVSSGVLVLTAVPEDACLKVLTAQDPSVVTCVLLMALGGRARIAAHLLERGFRTDVPAAVVLGATTARAWSWIGTLGELGGVTLPPDRDDLPGLVVLGDVVAAAAPIRAALGVEPAFTLGYHDLAEVHLGSA